MTHPAPLLATTDAAAITDGLMLLVVGVSVVFAALVLILVTIKLLGRVDTAIELSGRKPAGAKYAPGGEDAPPVASPSQPGPAGTSGSPGPELIAVLAAAATAALRRPVRVTRVRFVSAAPAPGWVVAGRGGIMTSHRPHLHRRR